MATTWAWLNFHDLGVDRLYECLALRSKVFILEQGPFLDCDGADTTSWHLLGRSPEGILHSYLRVVHPGVIFPEPSIGRVVTAIEVRGQGFGRALMAEGVRRCEQAHPGLGIRINAQARLERFYNGLGFEASAAPHIEDGIPHLEMLRRV